MTSDRGAWTTAVDALNQAISFNPRASSYYYVLAGVYRRLGRMDESRKALEMFKRLEQETSELDKKRARRRQLPQHVRRGRTRIVSSGAASIAERRSQSPSRVPADARGLRPAARAVTRPAGDDQARRAQSGRRRLHRRHRGGRPVAEP